MTSSGWRNVRLTERRAISATWCSAAGRAARRRRRGRSSPRGGLGTPAPRRLASSSSSAPSSERPVFSRKTSSSEGWCSCRSATRDAVARRARARRRRAPRRRRSSRTATLFGLPAAGSPKRRQRRAPRRSLSFGFGRRRLERDAADLGLQRGRRALGDDVAVVDDPDAVGEDVGLLEVLRREEDGHAVLARQALDLAPQRAAALRVQAGRRLVEEQHARAVQQREREVQAALHAAGVAADLAARGVAQPDAVEQLLAARGGTRPSRGRAAPPWRSMCSQPVRKSSSAASCSAAPIVRRICRPVASMTSRPATRRASRRSGGSSVDEHQHGRRLAGAVGPEEAVDLARRDLQVDAVDGLDPALELAREPLDEDAVVALAIRRRRPRTAGAGPGRRTSRVGRISRPSRFCSRMCADQPATRAQVNMLVKSSGGISAMSSTTADQNSTFVASTRSGLRACSSASAACLERLGDLEALRRRARAPCGAARGRAGPRRGRRGGRSPSAGRRGRARALTQRVGVAHRARPRRASSARATARRRAAGRDSAPTAPESAAATSAPVEAMTRAVNVEAFMPCSAAEIQ